MLTDNSLGWLTAAVGAVVLFAGAFESKAGEDRFGSRRVLLTLWGLALFATGLGMHQLAVAEGPCSASANAQLPAAAHCYHGAPRP